MTKELDPYRGLAEHQWKGKTLELIKSHPLRVEEIVEVTLKSWEDIFEQTRIGSKPFQIGKDIFPKPQILSFLLHELIPLELAERHPGIWKREENAGEKDLVYVPNPFFSVEIKASSHRSQIFGNRSFAQQSSKAKKSKSGFYLAINFEPCKATNETSAKINKIRFGWLQHADWTGQTASTGQQARLSPEVERSKLIQLYPVV